MQRPVGKTTPVSQPRRRSRLLAAEERDGFLFILPWLIGFVVFTAGPMLTSLVMAFLDWEIVRPPAWAGLKNLERLVVDPLFRLSLYNTAYFVFFSVPLYLVAALLAALAMNQPLRGIRIYRVAYYLPSQVPAVASALLWLWIFNPTFGLANGLLRLLDIPAQMWLQDPTQSKPVLIFMGLWSIGGTMVIFLAGLQGIPVHLHEAASLDGAGTWQRFRYVTLPMVTPVIFFNLVIGIIGAFQSGFTQTYIMTGGGPSNSTLLTILYIYRNGFEFFRMGYASALSWSLFLIIVVFTALQFRASQTWVYYEGGVR
ncbi:MAG: sugar ABC transporter permease [Chloroflexi bacterium]|nr:sugar ABC transporter permease [Chloroflexota bacterium]